MRTVSGIFLALGLASVIGLGLTAASIGRGTGAGTTKLGAWQAAPKSGTLDADPYSRAVNARLGALPLALADGISLIADTDDDGVTLDGRCTVRVTGAMPAARYWTIALVDTSYHSVLSTAGRQVFTSYEVVRQGSPAIDVVVAAGARPGNWLPTGGIERYHLVLRLYDTPSATTLQAGQDLPTVRRVSCP